MITALLVFNGAVSFTLAYLFLAMANEEDTPKRQRPWFMIAGFGFLCMVIWGIESAFRLNAPS